MWIFTKVGFFSIVQKPSNSPDELTVRARVRSDLAALAAGLPQGSCSEIQETDRSDYPYRCVVNRAELAAWLSDQVTDGVNYPNFKDEILRRQGPFRASIYHDVWATLLALVGADKSLADFRRRFPLRSMRFPS